MLKIRKYYRDISFWLNIILISSILLFPRQAGELAGKLCGGFVTAFESICKNN